MGLALQLTESPRFYPHHCIDGREDGPVVDTFIDIDTQRVYLSRQMLRDGIRLYPDTVEELAGEIGWVSADEHSQALADLHVLIADMEGRLAELQAVESAVARAAGQWKSSDDEPIRKKPVTEKRAA